METYRQRDVDRRVVDLIRRREIWDTTARTVSQKLYVTDSLISRLGLEKELKGHSGCVNCLEWNESGQVLASASDDRHVILWDPFRYEKKFVLRTGHYGNIFSVKFMPKTNDNVLISAAADHKVRVHDLNLTEPIVVCKCHTGRVKRIATAATSPSLFWSVAEDGLVLQYDNRVPHICKSQEPNVLINLVNHIGKQAEGKCIAVNSKRPELLAVGANDPYIRMYDRRMIKPSQLPIIFPEEERVNLNAYRGSGSVGAVEGAEGDKDNNIPLSSARYFIAGHLLSRQRDGNRSLTATYLTFSADGHELLVNMGGEQIYLFDINDPKCYKTFLDRSIRRASSEFMGKESRNRNSYLTNDDDENDRCEDEIVDDTRRNMKTLPRHVEELKRKANEGFEQQKYTTAIHLYNKAISYCPTAAVLFANRAAAFMKRAWDGDIYAALRDCQTTLLLDPQHVKAHFRLARCLFDLNRSNEADRVIKSFQRKFPEYASNSACRALKMDIKEAIESGRDRNRSDEHQEISSYEKEWRRKTTDYKMRFCGHCNTTTDIKEANFFGNSGQYIVGGSDDGSFFIWDQNTTNIVRVLKGDERIVNCLQPHPSTCFLATSGIDPVIRLWSPLPEDGRVNEQEVPNLEDAASANQERMNRDPFELMLINMGYRYPVQSSSDDPSDDSEGPNEPAVIQPLNCRPS